MKRRILQFKSVILISSNSKSQHMLFYYIGIDVYYVSKVATPELFDW